MYQTISEQQLADKLAMACENKLKAKFPSIELTRKDITKLNGISKDALVSKLETSMISPVIYVDGYVDAVTNQKLSFDDAVKSMCNTFEEHMNDVTLPCISVDGAKESLYVIPVNRISNADMLASTPHRDLTGDVSMVMRYKVKDLPDARASFLIKDEILSNMGLTDSEAFDIAISNTIKDGYTVKSMAETLGGLGIPDEFLDDFDLPIKVITNKEAVEGAIGPFISQDIRKEIFESINCDDGYYIIPSSRHEVLAIASTLGTPEDIQALVKQVNSTELRREDILSDEVFKVDANLNISCCTDSLDSVIGETESLSSKAACI